MSETKNVKEKKERTVSTSFLEKIRERKELSVQSFLKEIMDFQSQTPSQTFQECLTAYADKNRLRGTGSSSSNKDPMYEKIHYIVDNNLTKIGGIITKNGIRRSKGAEGIYSVTLEQDAGTKATTQFNMRDLSNVSITVNGLLVDSGIDLTRINNDSQFDTVEDTTQDPMFETKSFVEETSSYSANGSFLDS